MWKAEGGIRFLSSNKKFTIVNPQNPIQNISSFRFLNYIYHFVKRYFYPAMTQVHYCELSKRGRGFHYSGVQVFFHYGLKVIGDRFQTYTQGGVGKLYVPSAGNRHFGPGHKTGLVGSQESHHIGNLLRLASPFQRGIFNDHGSIFISHL